MKKRGVELKKKYGAWLPYNQWWKITADMKTIQVIEQKKLDPQ